MTSRMMTTWMERTFSLKQPITQLKYLFKLHMVITNVVHYETSSMSITPSSCQKKTFIRIRDTVSIWIKSTSSILTLTIGFMDHTLDRIHTNGDNIWKTTYEEQTKIGLNDLGSLFFLTILFTALTTLTWIPHV